MELLDLSIGITLAMDRGMNFLKRVIFGFILGLGIGTASAAVSEEAFFATETFIVHSDRMTSVGNAMESLGLQEDVDFAWMNRSAKKGSGANLVCYSSDCHQWATQSLATLAN
jgi:hypothetical protein